MSHFHELFGFRQLMLAALCVTSGCSKQDMHAQAPSADPDAGAAYAGLDSLPFADVFPSDQLLDVELSLEGRDWDQLRFQGRSLNDVFSGCREPYEYTLMPAEASFDGHPHGRIQVRKKGFLGSLSVTRPSLRLELEHEHYRDRSELTLNNNLSDGSLMRQCLAYQLFEKAGFAASGCAFASVRLNDRDLGVYTNIEAVKRDLLQRHFGSAEGNLYEGNALADFRADRLEYFERKNNPKQPASNELRAVAAALEIEDDAEMLAALEPLLDVDSFIRFWATEVLVGHWDGYAGNTNNFYVYLDPRSDKLVFIPWGTDGAFVATHAFLPPTGRPPITLAVGRLPRRLYAYEPTRERYYTQLRDLLDHVWNEEHLQSEIDRMSELLGGDRVNPSSVADLRGFIAVRRDAIEKELSAPLVPWSIPERQVGSCRPEATSPITGTFSGTWATLSSPVATGHASGFALNLDGKHLEVSAVSGAGLADQSAAVRMYARLPDGRNLVVHVELPALPTALPADVPMHGFETFGVVVVSAGGEAEAITLGYISSGTLHFDQASNADGAPISGSLDAQFTQTILLPPAQP